MERRKFTREFKLEAVKLVKERGVAVSQASHDLGVHQTQLRKWVKDFSFDAAEAFAAGYFAISSAVFPINGLPLCFSVSAWKW